MSETVIYVENGLNGGGSAESMIQLLSALDRTRYRPICVFTSAIPHVERVHAMGIEVVQLRSWYFSRCDTRFGACLSWLANAVVIHGSRIAPRFALSLDRLFTRSLRARLAALIQREHATLVHTNNTPHRDLWAIEAATDAGAACVAHARSFHGLGFSWHRAASVNARVSRFVAYSRSVAAYWTARGAADRFDVVHNAIGEIEAEAADLASLCRVPPGTVTIGLVGRIIPDRGHHLLIEAMPYLKERVPNVRLLVVGGGEPSAIRALTLLATQLGCADAVSFLGHRPDAREIVAALDVLVLPYTIEPFGRTLLEAWQLGVPVVLSDVGHIADIVRDGEDALLTPLVPAEIAERIARVLQDGALKRRLVKNGAETCRRRFRIESHAAAIQSIYDAVVRLRATRLAEASRQMASPTRADALCPSWKIKAGDPIGCPENERPEKQSRR